MCFGIYCILVSNYQIDMISFLAFFVLSLSVNVFYEMRLVLALGLGLMRLVLALGLGLGFFRIWMYLAILADKMTSCHFSC